MRVLPPRKPKAPKVTTPITRTDEHGITWASHSIYATPSELYRDPLLEHNDRWMHAGLLAAFDRVRHELGHALVIRSGRRSQAAQDSLRARGYKAATHSPHVAGVALDIQTPAHMRDVQLAGMLKSAVLDVCGILPRLGYVGYRDGAKSSLWVHVDVAPSIWRDGMPEAWKIEGLLW